MRRDSSLIEARPTERTVPLSVAESAALRAIAEFGLRPQLVELDDNREGPTAWSVTLVDDRGVAPAGAEGSGKGSGTEARVGALFEALEHLLSGPVSFDPEEVRLCRIRDCLVGPLAADASMAVLAETPHKALGCLAYGAMGSDRRIDVPVYLSSPWYVVDSGRNLRAAAGDTFDYRRIARYTINSGTAIGMSEAEATLHALNEVVERDAVSLLLTQSFLGRKIPPRPVRPDSLPERLAGLLSYVADRSGLPVRLLDITTELGVPAYLAYVPPTSERPHLRGAGASLSAEYAAYRALSELLQGFLHRQGREDPPASLGALHRYPALYACGQFDLAGPLAAAEEVPFIAPAFPADPRAQLTELSSRVRAAGFSVFSRRVRRLPGGITTVHVLVPGLERFVLVLDGYAVTPGARGIRAAKTGTTRVSRDVSPSGSSIAENFRHKQNLPPANSFRVLHSHN